MDKVVKVDRELLKEIEEFIKKNKFIYSSKKQVVNLAIIEFLKSKSSLIKTALFKKAFLKRSLGKKKRETWERKKKRKNG